jgi:putative peptidoglycan lipid II flippase
MHETLSRALRVIMFFSIPAAVGLALLAKPATAVLLQRGEFTAFDTEVTSAALAWFCLGIVPWAGIEIHSRGFYAIGDTLTPVIFAVGAVGLNLGLSAWLFAGFEHEGLAFAVSAAAWLEWLALYYAYRVKTGAPVAADLRALSLMSLCAAVMALILVVALVRLDTDGWFEHSVMAVGGGAAGALIYVGAARVAGIAEVDEAFSRLFGRFRRTAVSPGVESS